MISITVSGMSGAGKTSLSKALVDKLGLKYWSVGKDYFREKAAELGIDIAEMMKQATPAMHKEADELTKQKAAEGGWILEGRLAGWMAGDKAFKIFVKASVAVRAARLANREGKELKEATEYIESRDKIDAQEFKQVYKIDMWDLSVYDLVLDTGRFDKQQVAEIVGSIAEKLIKG
ncbi:MAG: AAA family ATPase [Candidatus Altiarchaeota archaeon]|nr:AAA family ATPase [Candidatus Altiarchaeota archaeon]